MESRALSNVFEFKGRLEEDFCFLNEQSARLQRFLNKRWLFLEKFRQFRTKLRVDVDLNMSLKKQGRLGLVYLNMFI